jgi:nitrile hydratase
MALHDMGGNRDFFGPVLHAREEPVFHERWEARVFGMSIAYGAAYDRNVDAMRDAMERLPAREYLSSYYGRWFEALIRQLEARGLLAPGETDARAEKGPAMSAPSPAPLRGRFLARVLPLFLRPLPRWLIRWVSAFTSARRFTLHSPRFRVGERVRTIAQRPPGHTRIPGYACGRVGTVVARHGAMVFPDTHARREGEHPQHLYTVSFPGHELWGEEAEPATSVSLDLFESYLEPMGPS